MTSGIERERTALQHIAGLAQAHGHGFVAVCSLSDLVLPSLVAAASPQTPILLVDTGTLHHSALDNLALAQRLRYRVLTVSSPIGPHEECHHDAKRRGLEHALLGVTAFVAGLRHADSEARSTLAPVSMVGTAERHLPLLSWTDEHVSAYAGFHGLPERAEDYVHCVACQVPGEKTECGLWTDLVSN